MPRHSTMTDAARAVADLITREGVVVHPGIINPKAGRSGNVRIKIRIEGGRTTIVVSGTGVQELHVYGPLPESVLDRLRTEYPGLVIAP